MRYKSYDDPAVLRELQLVLTEVLAEYDRICRTLNLPYVICAGTAIGAVRHGGFIPWDDDADVYMLRADYERFLREAPGVCDPKFCIDNMRNQPDFPTTYTFFGLKGTAFVPEYYRSITYRRPISLDIFPLDNVPDDDRAYRRQARRTWLWGRLLALRATPIPHIELDGLPERLFRGAAWTIHTALRALRVPHRALQYRWERAARQYEHTSTRLVADYNDRKPLRWAATHDELFPPRMVPFENLTLPVAREYDTVLRRGYGNYTQLPPMENRKNHFPHALELPEG